MCYQLPNPPRNAAQLATHLQVAFPEGTAQLQFVCETDFTQQELPQLRQR